MEVAGQFVKQIIYTDTTETLVGSLPPNALITEIVAIVSTAFSAGGADVIDVGISGTAAYFANDIDVSSVARASVTLATTGLGVISEANTTDVYATYIPAGSAPTAGVCEIVVKYIQK